MLANVVLQAFNSVMPDYEPKLERSKTPAEWDMPVAIINHCAGFRRLITQIFRQHRERLNQVLAVRDIEDAAIAICEHPFMRIEVIAIREFHAILNETEFWT